MTALSVSIVLLVAGTVAVIGGSMAADRKTPKNKAGTVDPGVPQGGKGPGAALMWMSTTVLFGYLAVLVGLATLAVAVT